MRVIGFRSSLQAKRTLRKTFLLRLSRRKRKFTKLNYFNFLGVAYFTRRSYLLARLRRFFTRVSLARKNRVLYQKLKQFYIHASWGLFFSIKSKDEYIRMKREIELSQLSCELLFVHPTRRWAEKIFSAHPHYTTLVHAMNGALLVIRITTLADLLITYDALDHPSTVCVGFLVRGRFVLPDYGLMALVELTTRCKEMARVLMTTSYQVLLKLVGLLRRVIGSFIMLRRSFISVGV
jgi:hypothetical protein